MARLDKNFYTMRSLLTEWYGRERAKHEINAYTPKAESIGDVANKILKKTVSPELARSIKVRDNWEEIVGAQIAKVTSPLSFDKKILTVQVMHSVWLRELSFGPSKNMIIKKINDYCGEKVCSELRLVPGGR